MNLLKKKFKAASNLSIFEFQTEYKILNIFKWQHYLIEKINTIKVEKC